MASILFLHESPFEYTGVLSLCGYLASEGHEVDVLIKSQERKQFWDKVKDFKPDWVGFSAIYGLHYESFRLAREVKERIGVGTIFGGPYATHFSDCIKREEVDFLIQGEAEEALLDFLNTHDQGGDCRELANIWYKQNGDVASNPVRPLEYNLDKYPIPDRHYYYKYGYLRNNFEKQFMSGRGCPYKCYFCFNSKFQDIYGIKGKQNIRKQSPGRMLEELAICKSKYPMRTVCFNDDIFTVNRAWLEEFLPQYKKEIGVPFSCQVRADSIDEDTAKLLGENCCDHIMIGLESGNPRVRKMIIGKNFTNERFYKTADLLHKHGIRIKNYNILGCPTETLEEALETMEVNARAKVELPWCAIFQPIPGTRTAEIAREHGYLSDDHSADNVVTSIFQGSVLKQPEIREIERAHKLFYIGARHKWTIPIIRKLAKCRLGPVYHWIFLITSIRRFLKQSRYDVVGIVKFGINHLRNY